MMTKYILTTLLVVLFSTQLFSTGLKINPQFSKSKLTLQSAFVSDFSFSSFQESVPTGSSNYKQIANGYLYGLLFGGGGALLSIPFLDKVNPDLALPFQVGLVGYVIGSAFGVYNSGTDEYTDASFTATFIGSIIGTALFIIPAPFGALLGFNYTKTEKQKLIKTQMLKKNHYTKIIQFNLKF